MDVQAFLDRLRGLSWYDGQVVDDRTLPPRDAVEQALEYPLHPTLEARLAELGRWPLYAHQAAAIDAALEGQNVVVATPAASGKSLCFQAPVLHEWLEDRSSRALLLYPTKALAQDQLTALRELAAPSGERAPARPAPTLAVYDGDTPHDERAGIRRSAHVLLTNPDMLHAGILPNHKSWAAFLQRLDTVVIDEAHTYRGVFGSHVSLLLRRLRRVCARYGAEPRFILCSATIGNPVELAENLTGEPFTAVTDSGAPLGEKRFLFWNPPLRDAESGVREKAYGESARLLAETTRAGVRTIAFVRTRRTAELVFGAARDMVAEKEPALANRLAPYRAHYMAEDRRRIEEGLREGKLLGVAATNALELGMDIGGLDATVLTGYPGSVASAWQQAGRGGRRGEASLAVLVARDDPLDQYLMRHPEFFHGRPMEHALIAPENPYVLAPHLLCAAHEFPLTLGDRAYFGDALPAQLDELVESGHLRPTRGRWHLDPTVDYPAQHVHLRSTSDRSYTVVDGGTGALLEAGVEASAAYSSLYPGAIYLHQGEPFLVTELNIAGETAVVTAAKEPYYTQSRDITDIRVLNTYRRRTVSVDVRVCLGEVEVTRQVVAYRKLAHYTEANLGDEILDLPAHRFRTVALWFEAPPVTVEDILEGKRDLAGGLHAAEHAAIGVLPLFALCDRADIGGVSTPMHPDTGVPTVFIYDGYPGGIGIAERGFEAVEALWRTTLQVVEECPCSEGCPACVQSPKCGNNNHPLDKAVAAELLRGLLNLRR